MDTGTASVKLYKTNFYYEIADYSRFRLVLISLRDHRTYSKQLDDSNMRKAQQIIEQYGVFPTTFLEILVVTGYTKQQILDILDECKII